MRISSCAAACRRLWGSAARIDHFLLTCAEHKLLNEADLVYSPSEHAAAYYRRKIGIDAHIIRPPFEVGTDQSCVTYDGLPDRFLLHIGNIDRVKGSDVLANALVVAWRFEPELQMVWAGSDRNRLVERFSSAWGENANKVLWLGPVNRNVVPAIIRQAVAIVSPSRVDNLPNSVLEAQSMNVPVIGSYSSSIDEIVVDNKTGKLVFQGDVSGLAQALVTAWRGEPPFASKCDLPPIFEELRSECAIQSLLDATAEVLRSKGLAKSN